VRIGRIRRDDTGVRIEASGRRMLFVSVFLALVAVGVGAAAVSEESFWTRLFYGAVAIGVAGIAISGFWQSRKRTIPMITVTDEGIEHVKAGLIRWDEIEDVREFSSYGNRMLGIWTADPFLVAQRGKAWWIWPFAALNSMLGYPAIAVPNTVASVDDLLAEIEARARKNSFGNEP
jgi:hypothetical protein